MENTENNEVKTGRGRVEERMRKKHPEMDFTDDEAVFSRIGDDYDEYDKTIEGYRDREKQFSDLFRKDHRSARIVSAWSQGNDPIVELVRMYGTDIKDVIDNPERIDEIAEANKEFVDRLAESERLESEYEKNIASSLEAFDKMQAEKGLSDEQAEAAWTLLTSIVRDGIVGKFSPESIEMAIKATGYDTAVADAKQEGEVKGRNAKIDAKLDRSNKGDGVTMVSGSGGQNSKPKRNDIFALAELAR